MKVLACILTIFVSCFILQNESLFLYWTIYCLICTYTCIMYLISILCHECIELWKTTFSFSGEENVGFLIIFLLKKWVIFVTLWINDYFKFWLMYIWLIYSCFHTIMFSKGLYIISILLHVHFIIWVEVENLGVYTIIMYSIKNLKRLSILCFHLKLRVSKKCIFVALS